MAHGAFSIGLVIADRASGPFRTGSDVAIAQGEAEIERVEFSPYLCRIARNNLCSARLLRRRSAALYPLHPELPRRGGTARRTRARPVL